MPLILALDAAAGPCSAAVSDGDTMLAEMREEAPHAQAARLIPLVEACMQSAKLQYAALNAIAVTIGPGSFTGIRIGLAAARGLALAARKPLRGVGTLSLLAYQARHSHEKNGVMDNIDAIIAAMIAGKGQVFLQRFDLAPVPQPIMEASATEITELSSLLPASGHFLVCGSGHEYVAALSTASLKIVPSGALLPHAGALALFAQHHPDTENRAVYMRAADAKLPVIK